MTAQRTTTKAPPEPTDQLMTAAQVADLLGIGQRSVWRWRSEGRIPAPVLLGPRTARWRLSAIEQWLTALEGADLDGAA